jgi:hypothetical protein
MVSAFLKRHSQDLLIALAQIPADAHLEDPPGRAVLGLAVPYHLADGL